MQRLAVISLHTSPLAQPGSGDSGGMNVYVRELASSLAQAGVDCTTYTRATSADAPAEIIIEPGHRVVHIAAGPYDLPKESLCEVLDEFTAGVLEHIERSGGVDVVHANYWLSGVVAHQIKHILEIPLVTTFHTLARVKAEGGDPEPLFRELVELDIVGCADAICVSCPDEEAQFRRLYGDPSGLVEIVAPGVERAFFSPGDRIGARQAIDLPVDRPVVLFVGRIQALKGPDLAISALAEMETSDAMLVIVGGASGPDGDADRAALDGLVADLGLGERVRFVPPQPHHTLSTYYRAADVVVVPSRSESFGLVALEAAACGIPVVASAVGGLLSLVDHERTGLLVDQRTPDAFATALDRIIGDPEWAQSMSRAAAERARSHTWGFAAARARRLYLDLGARAPVACG